MRSTGIRSLVHDLQHAGLRSGGGEGKLKVTRRAWRTATCTVTWSRTDVERRYRQALISSAKSRSLRATKHPFSHSSFLRAHRWSRDGLLIGELSIGVCNLQCFRERANSTSETQYYKIIDCQPFCSVSMPTSTFKLRLHEREFRVGNDVPIPGARFSRKLTSP